MTMTTNVANLDLWFVAQKYLERCASPGSHTWRAKKRDLILFTGFVSELHGTSAKLKHLTVANVAAFRDAELKRGMAPGSVCRALATLRHLEKKVGEFYGIRQELKAVKSPALPPRKPKELSVKQREEIRAWLAAIPSKTMRLRNTLIYEFALATGARAMEVLEPTIEQLCWDEGVVKDVRCKGAKYRDLPLPAYLNKHMLPWMKQRSKILTRVFREKGKDWDAVPYEKQLKYPLFISTKRATPGKPETFRCTYGIVKHLFRDMSQDLGFRVHAHLCRHTRAHGLMRATKDIRLVQKALGHSDMTTTMIYTEIAMEEVHAVQEQLQL